MTSDYFFEKNYLLKRLLNALDFAEQTVKILGESGYNYSGEFSYKISPEKIIGETAFIMLEALDAGAYIEVQGKIDYLAKILIPYARNSHYLVNICLTPALALDYAYAHICLHKLGYPDEKFGSVLQQSLIAQSSLGCERTPYRLIERQVLRKWWDNSSSSVSELLTHTLLNNPIDLLFSTKEDRYAFTHAIMYASCLKVSVSSLPRNADVLIEEVDAMLAMSIDEQDYDLATELLLSYPVLKKKWTPVSIFSFRIITDIEDKLGFLPSQAVQMKIPCDLSKEERQKYILATSYHTVYTMALLCSTILKQDKNNNDKCANIEYSVQDSDEIINYITYEDKNPYWLTFFNNLNKEEQNCFIPFLFNIALLQNAKQKKFENLYCLLKIGYKLNLANSALAIQTAELLERIKFLSGVLA